MDEANKKKKNIHKINSFMGSNNQKIQIKLIYEYMYYVQVYFSFIELFNF